MQKTTIAIICAVLICLAGGWWISTTGLWNPSSRPVWLIKNAMPFLLLLGIWIFPIIRKFPNGMRPSKF
jgi:hypothetical protein